MPRLGGNGEPSLDQAKMSDERSAFMPRGDQASLISTSESRSESAALSDASSAGLLLARLPQSICRINAIYCLFAMDRPARPGSVAPPNEDRDSRSTFRDRRRPTRSQFWRGRRENAFGEAETSLLWPKARCVRHKHPIGGRMVGSQPVVGRVVETKRPWARDPLGHFDPGNSRLKGGEWMIPAVQMSRTSGCAERRTERAPNIAA